MKLTNKYNLPAAYVFAVDMDQHQRMSDLSASRAMNPTQITILQERHGDELIQDVSELSWALLGKAGHKVLEQGARIASGAIYLSIGGHEHKISVGLAKELLACEAAGTMGEIIVKQLEESIAKGPVIQTWSEEPLAMLITEDRIVPISIDRAKDLIAGPHEGTVFAGIIDHTADGVIIDWKFTSVWTWIYKSRIDDYRKQLSLYCLLAKVNGIEINKAQIIMVLRDWSKNNALKHDYPDHDVQTLPISLWDLDKTEEWLRNRIVLLEAERQKSDSELTPCSEAERWASPEKWAVYKNPKAKRALRVLDTEEEAKAYTTGGIIKHRPGANRRCEDYCPCSVVCHQYQELQKE